MSKYLGKLLLETGSVCEQSLDSVLVKYVRERDAFCFRYQGNNGGGIFYVKRGLCYQVAKMKGMLTFQYRWSTGYVVKEKRDASELRALRDEELNVLGGRRELIMSGQLDNDDDFNYLCAIQCLFKFSVSELDKAMRQWKKKKWGKSEELWLSLDKRVLGHSGRKKGGKNNSDLDSEKESISDILLRVRHNKKVAVSKGFLEWYIEACKEECKALDTKFDKDKCLAEWNELRRECE